MTALRRDIALFGEALAEASRRALGSRGPEARISNWVTALLDDCARRVALWRTQGAKAKPLDEEARSGMEEGTRREAEFVSFLTEHGFEVWRDRPGVRARWEEFNISGKVDLWIGRKLPDGSLAFGPLLVEHKAPRTPWAWKKCGSLGDLLEDRWHRKWVGQAAFYGWMLGERWTALAIKRPGYVEWGVVEIDGEALEVVELVDEMQRNAAAAEAVAAGGPLPAYLQGDPDECRGCAFFGRACFPEVGDPGGVELGIELSGDEEFMRAVRDRELLRNARDRYEEADGTVKDRLRAPLRALAGEDRKKVTLLLAGYEATLTVTARTTYAVPEEVRAQYRVTDKRGGSRIELKPIEAAAGSEGAPAVA